MAVSRSAESHRRELETYLKSPVRPPYHAGTAYAGHRHELRRRLDELLTHAKPRPPAAGGRPLRGVLVPHIDPARGGPAYAEAYRAIIEHSRADVFVIFGTAHQPMRERVSVSRKDFHTPLGTVRTDRKFIDRLAAELAGSVAGRGLDLFKDELAHRQEHSIEFQTVFLRYALGGQRALKIVPILMASFYDLLADGRQPALEPELQAFIAAVRAATEPGENVCYLSSADLAHVGTYFGDRWRLTERLLDAQAQDDGKLLGAISAGDAAALFQHVAGNGDRHRICGLAPTYMMLETLGPTRGEVLRYDQAIEPDRTACVSFAAATFW
jgi:MEMO1 family protein